MKTYSEKLRDPRWQRKKAEVILRDDCTCNDCGDTEKTLNVHHCHYERGGPWDTADGLLMTLCEDCHKRRQKLEDGVRRSLGIMFAKMEIQELESFSESASKVEQCASPMIYDAYQIHCDNDRWLREAIFNPVLRTRYEELTGEKPDWEHYDRPSSEMDSGVPF